MRRSARVGTLLATLAVGAACWVAATQGGVRGGAVVGALTGGGLAVAIALLSRDHPIAVAGGGLLVFPSGVGLAVALGLAVPPLYALDPGRVATVACVVVAAFGAAASWTDAGGEVRPALAPFAYGLLPVVGAFVLAAGVHLALGAALGRALAAAPRMAGRVVLAPSTRTVAVVSLPLLVTLAAGGVHRLLGTAPVVELAPRERRAAVADALDRAVTAFGAARLLAGVAFIAVGGLFVVGRAEGIVSAVPELLLGLVTAGPLRAALAWVALLSYAGWTVLATVRTVGRFERDRLAAVGAPLLSGGVVAAVAATVVRNRVFAVDLPPVARQSLSLLAGLVGETGAVLGGALLVVGALLYLLTSLVVVDRFGFLPDRGASVGLASAGVVGLAVVAGLGGWSPLVVFGLSACGLFAWDVGEHAATVGRELTPAARSRRVQVVHAGGSALAAVGGVTLAGVVLALSRGGTAPAAPVVAFVGGVLGALLLFAALR